MPASADDFEGAVSSSSPGVSSGLRGSPASEFAVATGDGLDGGGTAASTVVGLLLPID
jgi:hypothetical protein